MTAEPLPRRPGRPRDPDLEARRKSEILSVAAITFAEHGFAATDVQLIADQLGVGKGTIYRYFPTKESLFLAAVERGLAELDADLDAILTRPELAPLDQIRESIRTYFAFFRRRPEMAELFIQERAAFRGHHRPVYFSFKDDNANTCQRAALFEKLQQAGLVRPIPVERFFAVIGDLLYGTILTNLLTGRPADPDTQTADVLDVVFHGVLQPAAQASTESDRCE